jgi:hypothetical protein
VPIGSFIAFGRWCTPTLLVWHDTLLVKLVIHIKIVQCAVCYNRRVQCIEALMIHRINNLRNVYSCHAQARTWFVLAASMG